MVEAMNVSLNNICQPSQDYECFPQNICQPSQDYECFPQQHMPAKSGLWMLPSITFASQVRTMNVSLNNICQPSQDYECFPQQYMPAKSGLWMFPSTIYASHVRTWISKEILVCCCRFCVQWFYARDGFSCLLILLKLLTIAV